MTVSERIKELCYLRRVSQKEAAERSGMSPGQFSEIIKRGDCLISTLDRILVGLESSQAEFFTIQPPVLPTKQQSA